MKTFGRHLVEQGACSPEELEAATHSMVVYGGRLGTNLVEQGVLGIEELEGELAAFLGAPSAPREWLESPAPEALSILTPETAAEHRALPLRRDAGTLHVALRDPGDPRAASRLAAATGLAIRGYVAAELRLDALLEHHYGIPREMRFPHEAPGAEPGELIDEATFAELHASWQDRSLGAGAAAPAEIELTELDDASDPEALFDAAVLEAELLRAPDRDSVARVALRLARHHVRAAALFVVRGGIVSGFRGDGDGVAQAIDGILMPLEVPSALSRAALSGAPFRAAAPAAGIDHRVLKALGRENARELLVLPVRIRHHTVNLLYADNGRNPLGETAVAALTCLSGLVARAYEQLILARKRQLAGV